MTTTVQKVESLPRPTRKRGILGGVAEADHAAEQERRAGLHRRRHQRHLWDDPGGADVADFLAGAHPHSEQVSADRGTVILRLMVVIYLNYITSIFKFDFKSLENLYIKSRYF